MIACHQEVSERTDGAMRLGPTRTFHERYGHEMRLAFQQLCRDAYRRAGTPGAVGVWVRELPALLVGGMSERSTTMAGAVTAAGRAGIIRTVITANAVVLALFGAAMLFAPTDLLLAYGFLEPRQIPGPSAAGEAWSTVLPVKMMTQTLGATLIGAGGLVFATSRSPGGLAGPLAGAHALLAVAFAFNLAAYPSILGSLTMSLATAFAAAYTGFWLAESVRPAPSDRRRQLADG